MAMTRRHLLSRPRSRPAGPPAAVQRRLVQSLDLADRGPQPLVADPKLTYDAKGTGGAATLVVDASDRPLEQRLSLAGTSVTRSGGMTPWGTWLICEVTEEQAGPAADRDHGFVFEVDPVHQWHNTLPTPLTALGRFAHSAVCVDALRGHVYLTEEATDPFGLVYRCEPRDRTHRYGSLREGGRLSVMRCTFRGVHVLDLSAASVLGTTLQVEWVRVPDPLAVDRSIRRQLDDDEVTRMHGLDRAWVGHRKVHLSSSTDAGRTWRYDPARGSITLGWS